MAFPKSIFLFSIFTVISFCLKAQGTLEWQNLGPDNIGGRTRALIVDNSDGNKIYAGCTTGGLWRSLNKGAGWAKVEGLEYPMVSTLVQSANGDIYVGTGDYFSPNSGQGYGGRPGNGVYKSTDNGESFNHLTETSSTILNDLSGDWSHILDLEVHPSLNQRVYAATNRGLRISSDGGNTWSIPSGMEDDTSPAYSVAVGGNGTVHCSQGEFYYRSEDGLSFVQEAADELGRLPLVEGRKRIAVSPTNPEFAFAVFANTSGCLHKVYRTVDNGAVWYEISGEGTTVFDPFLKNDGDCIGNYAMALAVDPEDPNRLYLGGYEFYEWTESDWWVLKEPLTEYENDTYFDFNLIHEFVFNPNSANHMYIGTDAGIYRSLDGASTFNYKVRDYICSELMGAAVQDNGHLLAATQKFGFLRQDFDGNPSYAELLWSGEGVNVFTSSIRPGMALLLQTHGTARRTLNYFNFPWFLGVDIDCYPLTGLGACAGDGIPDNGSHYYLNNVYWEHPDVSVPVSRYFSGDAAGMVWQSDSIPKSNGSGGFYVGTESYWRILDSLKNHEGEASVISTLALSEDGAVLWAGGTDGSLIRITGIGEEEQTSFTVHSSLFGPQGDARYITSIYIDPLNSERVFVGCGSYGYSRNVFAALDGLSEVSVNFKSIQNNLPELPVYDIILNKNNDDILVGTETGIFSSSNGGGSWVEDQVGMGNVPVTRFKQQAHPFEEDQTIILATTYGRGVFSINYNPDFTAVEDTDNLFSSSNLLSLSPNPTSGVFKLERNFELDQNSSNFTNEILAYDLKGKLVKQWNLDSEQNGSALDRELDISDLSNGVYVIRTNIFDLEGKSSSLSIKLVKVD